MSRPTIIKEVLHIYALAEEIGELESMITETSKEMKLHRDPAVKIEMGLRVKEQQEELALMKWQYQNFWTDFEKHLLDIIKKMRQKSLI